ncbi:unnamed protein product [Chilo suppressalis]|uniref:DNA2/NAM7 helicase helicase domain-containing protein n=1 Tax=Chilo suppressalis TaxID=168631 RepID=A0ABN8L565_CHISP|nr:unnamed protein product [Chilo suppressalis]
MCDGNKSSLRIDWFDGTLVAASSSNSNVITASNFDDEDQPQQQTQVKPQYVEKKPIGFNRLQQISLLKGFALTLEVAHRPGFWMLLDMELKGDFIVLIVDVLTNIYNSLEPYEKSRISTLLKTKFEKSMFLKTLNNYLTNLPFIRVVEKRMNTHFWDNPEVFYSNVILLFETMVNYDQKNIELLIEINDLLSITESSIVGVKEEHTERFSDELFVRIHKLQCKLGNLINKITDDDIPQSFKIINKDPNSFRNLSIFPTRGDLLANNQLLIQPNIVNGAYPSVETYLDLQFKLLREDCFGALRDGICSFINNPSKRRYENIRVHPKVRVIHTFVSNNKVGYLVDIAWKHRNNDSEFDTKKFAYNKQLMFGSLLLFTNDNFDTILCATVLDSNYNLLSDGYIAVSFESPVSKKIFLEPYLMVESEVFFEPYHRVLRVLQTFKESDMPMRKYIVDVQNETLPPSYLNVDTIYSITHTKISEELQFNVLNHDSWPESEIFELDDSQLEAFKLALTREFAVIQGPPGTGKTFIGVKIASMLLKNLSLEGTPMLIICYTNHALDQFLEGIHSVTQNIVRLGSQSKSKLLEGYTLNNLRSKVKSKYSHLYGKKRSELEKLFKGMTELQTEIEKCEKEILTYKTIKANLEIGGKLYELKNYDEDPVLSWLFDDVEHGKETMIDDSDDWEKQFDEVSVEDNKIETCFSAKWALKEIDSMMNSIKYVKDVTDDLLEGQKMIDKFDTAIRKIRKRISCFKEHVSLGLTEITENSISNVSNLYSLTKEQRWKLYYKCIGPIKKELMVKMNELLDQHTTCNKELEEVSTLVDGDVMRTARVVGVTTTTAARRHDLMRRLNSQIVIVEEAAEVLEAHIVASLTHHCQHLILIGKEIHFFLYKIFSY